MPQSLPLAPLSEPSLSPPGLKGPRATLVLELKRAGGLTAKALAQRLGLSLNAVRHHLKELEVAGLVRYAREHRGIGAPAFVYRLSAAGEGLFPRRYEEAVTRLLDHVVEREGRAAAVAVLESRYRELSARLRAALEDASPPERVAAVARVLADEGYMPEVRPSATPGLRLVEHNCPIQHVALRFPEVCEAEAQFLAEVLRAQVTRETHIASGCGTCEYHIETRLAPASPDRPHD
jgi:DeoR family suf operon transcriptional repressor